MAPANLPSAAADSSDPGPSPLSAAPVGSSFGDDFLDESRFQKFTRKIVQEPLIPLGCLATSYALYQASKSIRQGNPVRTNKMFRARIYAQGFTLVAIVAGSFFYRDERMKRRAGEEKLEEQRQREKKDKWLRELEVRDEEDRRWRARIEQAEREASLAASSGQPADKADKPRPADQVDKPKPADKVDKPKPGWGWWASTPTSTPASDNSTK
ncbi:hypothetical protein DV737_g4568, partial [Chaetothyriales sp. CBS 132003]